MRQPFVADRSRVGGNFWMKGALTRKRLRGGPNNFVARADASDISAAGLTCGYRRVPGILEGLFRRWNKCVGRGTIVDNPVGSLTAIDRADAVVVPGVDDLDRAIPNPVLPLAYRVALGGDTRATLSQQLR